MKSKAPFQAQKEIRQQERGAVPRTAVRKTPDSNMLSNSSTDTRFGHNFSQVPVRPVASVTRQDYSKASCPLSTTQRCPYGGACHTCPPRVQAKLKVGQVGDKYEREAELVADEVMRMPELEENKGRELDKHNNIPVLQRTLTNEGSSVDVPPDMHQLPQLSGQPLDQSTCAFMESRFGHDFSQVKIHADCRAGSLARDLSARAFTVGKDIFFADREYQPNSHGGRQLLAHELAHTVQQQSSNQKTSKPIPMGDASLISYKKAKTTGITLSGSAQMIHRFCTPDAICSGSIPGAAGNFDAGESALEVGPRERRRRMTPGRAISTGHSGRARQLEIFLQRERPGRLAEIQGIFIDQDLSSGTSGGASGGTSGMTMRCHDWVANSLPSGAPIPPGMTGAVRECTFVHGRLNQEALTFNRTSNATIGGSSREEWRVETRQLLVHETEHPRFETSTSGRAIPLGVTHARCTRGNVLGELSELAAVMSEFPIIFRAAAREASPTGPLHTFMSSWFNQSIHTGGENIRGALKQIGCSCECPGVNAFVKETFSEVTHSGRWTALEKNAFNTKLRIELPAVGNPSWPL